MNLAEYCVEALADKLKVIELEYDDYSAAGVASTFSFAREVKG